MRSILGLLLFHASDFFSFEQIRHNEVLMLVSIIQLLSSSCPQVSILKAISVLNPDLCNLVKFFERFEHMGCTCLSFEMLDRNLYDLLEGRQHKPMFPNAIRPVAKQVCVTVGRDRSSAVPEIYD